MKRKASKNPWIFSASFDLTWLLAPGFVAVCIVLVIHWFDPFSLLSKSSGSVRTNGDSLPPWIWFALIPCIDVSHVYSTLFRSYFDRQEFLRRKALFIFVPLACFSLAVLLYSFGKLLFWRVMAYIAVFHFIRQQYGFLALYHRKDKTDLDQRFFYFEKWTVYAMAGLPVIYWHLVSGGRNFEWFMEGDFLHFEIQPIADAIHALFWIWFSAYFLFQVYRYRKIGTVSYTKFLLVLNTALVWYVGIIYLNNDFAFTFTNVVNHGIPYIALLFAYSRFRYKFYPAPLFKAFSSVPIALLTFVGVLFFLAYTEEWLWDSFVWKEHSAFFWNSMIASKDIIGSGEAILVPLLFLPQFSHYVLDGFIWKLGKENPVLRDFLDN
ncbi:hypothetical protein CH373_00340 [Leptospira perolatii]|uniref:Uncharacterized protein n=1 Tax=Leptospira perolatii TaxID=2023191 RepID=A0A2M9ZSV3_9LEPT|nr:hypothetical protein CH360_00340 [Leptospira perolatii]PJZ75160.1 hypothetical protein CH373_00340 [Leptospira perolatii]